MNKFKKIAVCAVGISVTLLSTIPLFAAALHPYDVNGDGNVTVADYTYISTRMNGYKTSSYENLDVNNNGIFSIVDGNIVFDYAWNGTSTSSVSVQNFGNLLASNVETLNESDSTTYWKHDCNNPDNFEICDEYTLTLPGQTETAVTASIQPPTPMTVDNGETAIVKIVSEFADANGNHKSIGTGTIVGDNIVATAAHCVYDYNTGHFEDLAIQIIDSGDTVVEILYPRYIHIEKDYGMKYENNDTQTDYQDDYALLYFEDDLSEYGKFELGLGLESFVKDTTGTKRIKVSGFPAQSVWLPVGSSAGPRYVSEGSIICKSNNPLNLIHYNTVTYAGDSGAPAYVDEVYTFDGIQYNCKTMIGIHVGSNHQLVLPENYGWSCPITTDKLKFYRSNPYIS